MFKQIPKQDLQLADIPPSDSEWMTIWEFALTFDGYSYWGGSQECAEIANSRRHETLMELRTCLFYEQRRWHHFGDTPNEEAESYIRGLVGQIREKVANETRD